jgi:hypothetical protein
VSRLPLVLAVLVLILAAPAAAAPGDTARYILPPGNYGGLPTTDESRDQLPLYSGLTPLRRNVAAEDIERLFLPMDFTPIGGTRIEDTPRDDVTIVRDSNFGVPHVYGKTRAGAMFGAGYVGAEDRLFLMDVLRHAGRAQLSSFIGGSESNRKMDRDQWRIAPYTEADLQQQFDLGDEVYGEAGEAPLPVDLDDAGHMARAVEHDRARDRLPGEARAPAPGEHRHAVAARHAHGRLDVVPVARERHAERLDRVHRRVGREEEAGVGVEADLARKLPAKVRLEGARVVPCGCGRDGHRPDSTSRRGSAGPG